MVIFDRGESVAVFLRMLFFSTTHFLLGKLPPRPVPKDPQRNSVQNDVLASSPSFFLSYNGEENVGERKAQSSLFVVSFVLALNKAHVLALNTAHVLRLNKADVLALNKAHVLRLNNKICPVFRASQS